MVDIPLGGGKGGVICDPHNLSDREQEGICRGWVRQVALNVGPVQDVPAPDVMTHGQHMLWMLDEFERIRGAKFPGFITGKPVGMGGSLGRTEATGYGVMYTVREAMKELGIDIKKTGRPPSRASATSPSTPSSSSRNTAASPICVSCWDQNDKTSYTFKRESGIDPDELMAITDKFGTIDKAKARKAGYEILPGDAWIEQEVDLLVPAALENQVTGANVGKIHPRVKIIAEGANGPTTPEADAIIQKRGIFMIPDFLCNAGGVTCSYFEQVQCNMNYLLDPGRGPDAARRKDDGRVQGRLRPGPDEERLHARRGLHDRHHPGRRGLPPARLGLIPDRTGVLGSDLPAAPPPAGPLDLFGGGQRHEP